MKIEKWVSKKSEKNPAAFSTIQEGVAYMAKQPNETKKVLYIEEGVYLENVACRLANFTMSGHGNVEIRGNHYAKQKLSDDSERGTFRTSTVLIEGNSITLENLTISNTAGPGEKVGQAVALFNMGHQTVVKNCRLSGYQDTLCTGPLPLLQKDGTPFVTPVDDVHRFCRQLYEDCWIEGTIDFIFGGAQADFIHCTIHSRQSNNVGYITAASTPQDQENGYHFKNCVVTADENTAPVYLGRPWRPFAKVVFESCKMANHIHPAGWDNWQNKENEKSAYFFERNNWYPGTVIRPSWIHFERRE